MPPEAASLRAAWKLSWPPCRQPQAPVKIVLMPSVGRSVPQALFEVGRGSPEELRPAFEAAHRQWLISTDFERSVAVLKAGLADATADAACETLLVAHEVGGTDVQRRLSALVEDRVADLQGRKDARARQAGVRFSNAPDLNGVASVAVIPTLAPPC